MWERAILVIAALLLIAPELYSSHVGMVLLLLAVGAKQRSLTRSMAASAK